MKKPRRVVIADRSELERHPLPADEFMAEIFELEPGDYLITDESSLRDFNSFFDPDTSATWNLITERYGIERLDVGSERLHLIFAAIERKRTLQ